ncbi:sorting nexin-21 isoform X1 [Otolemur garnettii]|uniref:sorting nexin-21 isoform X1 n=1 Tax=Otolemur garnettii TaxID=30611 RepID=UPI000C7F6DFF|nr:sorting nexin-21 isoform X1 [Otolemur garnettii]
MWGPVVQSETQLQVGPQHWLRGLEIAWVSAHAWFSRGAVRRTDCPTGRECPRGVKGQQPGTEARLCLSFPVLPWAWVISDKPQLYTLAVMGPGPDHQPAHISRRYSDFERLHRNLQRQFRGTMAAISFPRKRLRRNFTAETIARRSRAFEQYLGHLHAVPELRHASDLQDFFVLPELRRAQSLTCTGLYREALALWANAWQLQAQLGTPSGPDRPLLTLAGLAVCHQELEDPAEARACCERALQLLGDKRLHPLLAPFLEAHVRLSWRLGLDKRQTEARLQALQEAGLTPTPPPSLKELLIKEVLD